MNIKFKLVFIVFSAVLLSSCGLELEENHNGYDTGRNTTKNIEDTTPSVSNNILVVVEESPFTGEEQKNTLNFYKLTQGDKFEINSTINPTEGIKEGSILFYSKNGYRVLSSLYNDIADTLTYEIFDIKSKQIIFTKTIDRNTNLDNYIFLPSLSKYLLEKNDGLYVGDIDKNIIDKLVFIDKISFLNILFSPDENKMAYIVEKDKEKFINIYDISLMKVINEISIGQGNLYLSQWSNSNRITYNYEMEAYAINEDGENKEYLGKYFFYPMYSPDGRYLVYSKPATFIYIHSLLDIEGYEEQNELGLYVLDTKTKELKVITNEYHDYIPLQWIETE